ncbi:virulence-associated E family protein, partial [Pseudomonas viridiflava]|uniref:virulence-associated E family protein n=1 Tax=Pseudomonas viridiflava TaxID=33069 RepID=UPI001F151B3C
FIGTTNHDSYLKDQTGNRRFWPVKVGTIKLEEFVADRDQLWAEAATREAAGESLILPAELWQAAAVEQESRVSDDPWTDILRNYLDGVVGETGFGPSDKIDRIQTSDLLTQALQVSPANQTPLHSQRLR